MAARPMRSQLYRKRRGASLVALLPLPIQSMLGLDDRSAVGSHRVQIGTRPSIQPGMIHVGDSRRHPHLEIRCRSWWLDLPGRSASEIVAFGVLDHLSPADGPFAIGHWWRVLRQGGRLIVGVDDASARLGDDHADRLQSLWSRQAGARDACVTSPLQIPHRRDAGTLYNEDLLRHVLECGGFDVVSVHTATPTSGPRPQVDWGDMPPVSDALLSGAEIVAVCRAR